MSMRESKTVASLLFTLTGMVILASGNLQADEAEATVKVERQTREVFRFNTVEVYINGGKVGTVDEGNMAEFKFTPIQDKNRVSFKIVGLLQTLDVGPTTFSAKAGSVNQVLLTCSRATKGECVVKVTPVGGDRALAIGKVNFKEKNVEKMGK